MCQFNLHIIVDTLYWDLAWVAHCTVYVVGVWPVSWAGSRAESVTECAGVMQQPGKLSVHHQQ